MSTMRCRRSRRRETSGSSRPGSGFARTAPGVEQRPCPQALDDQERPFQVVAAPGAGNLLEQPSREPVVILDPGGEDLRSSSSSACSRRTASIVSRDSRIRRSRFPSGACSRRHACVGVRQGKATRRGPSCGREPEPRRFAPEPPARGRPPRGRPRATTGNGPAPAAGRCSGRSRCSARSARGSRAGPPRGRSRARPGCGEPWPRPHGCRRRPRSRARPAPGRRVPLVRPGRGSASSWPKSVLTTLYWAEARPRRSPVSSVMASALR